jgi:L-malate glycosyltransferase
MVMNYSILHICSAFAKQQLYAQLVSHLDVENIPQMIYSAVRTESEAQWSSPLISRERYYSDQILNKFDRIFFRKKVRKMYNNLISKPIDLSKNCLVHAHFLYSDGAVALQLKKKHAIPFVVAIRNTDVNVFMKYRRDLKWVRDEILINASQLIFVSPVYKSNFLQSLNSVMREKLRVKCQIIPNGVEDSWLQPSIHIENGQSEVLRLLYVGDFSDNKNTLSTIKACEKLSVQFPVELTLVGGGGNGENKVLQYLDRANLPFVKYLGKIRDREELRKIYHNHDIFVMPSFKETFGVVYIEALSQGLPIIHSHNQGIDGYFSSDTVAEAVDPSSVADIVAKITVLKKRRLKVRKICMQESHKFAWPLIAKCYKQLYSSVLNDGNSHEHTSPYIWD